MARKYTHDWYRDRAMLGLSNKRPSKVLPPSTMSEERKAEIFARAAAYQAQMVADHEAREAAKQAG